MNVSSARWRLIVHLVTCVLLTFAAADLFVPELCASEKVVAQDSQHSDDNEQRPDDCFCCCSHVQRVEIAVFLSEDRSVLVEPMSPERPPLVEPRVLYRPPLHS